MASIVKLDGGRFRAFVVINGKRKSKVFTSRGAAKDWAAGQEYKRANSEKAADQTPFGEIMDRYAREVSVTKRGARWEQIRLEKLQRDPLARVRIGVLAPSDLANWRDRRLREVAPGSVNREIKLLSSVLTTARKEWRLIAENPLTDVKRPTNPPPRDRLPTPDEMERLAQSAGTDLTKRTARAFHAFKFAIETAMRAGEICRLDWDRIDLDRRVVRLILTKNGERRDVPLSTEAVRLLQELPRLTPAFGLTTRQLDPLWRKLRDRALVEDLVFHDSRHQAITNLSEQLDVLALARMVGHKNINELMTYYNETAERMARRLK